MIPDVCIGFLLPFLISGLLNKVGHQWTLRYLALLQGVLGGVALLGIKPRIPPLTYRNGQRRPSFIPPRIRFLKRQMFWTYVRTITFVTIQMRECIDYDLRSRSLTSYKPCHISQCLSILLSSQRPSHLLCLQRSY